MKVNIWILLSIFAIPFIFACFVFSAYAHDLLAFVLSLVALIIYLFIFALEFDKLCEDDW